MIASEPLAQALTLLDELTDESFMATIPCGGPVNPRGDMVGCSVHGREERGYLPLTNGECGHRRAHKLLVEMKIRKEK